MFKKPPVNDKLHYVALCFTCVRLDKKKKTDDGYAYCNERKLFVRTDAPACGV